ncbi:penicillin-binding protein 2 [Patescibacteria group bacterium]|nr:penicillin-binding protein 2 [Patescibacteria group bacterium]MBU1921619.1 penicillin-binding protein 2 [Patescibacteria group bacterium]
MNRKPRSVDLNDPFVVQAGMLKGTTVPKDIEKYTLDKDTGTEVKMEQGEEKKYLGVTVSNKKMTVFLVVIISLLVGLGVRAAYLQIGRGAYYYGLAENNRMRVEAIPSTRGIIYDRAGNLLVTNVSTFSLAMVPIDLPYGEEEREEALNRVVEKFVLNGDEIKTSLGNVPWNYNQGIIVKDNLTYEEALKIYLYSGDFPFLKIFTDSRREYLLADFAPSLSHVLGYMGKISDSDHESLEGMDYLKNDRIGKTGLELSHERDLRGRYGNKKIEVDALGFEKNIISREEQVDGSNLYLTIDLDLQKSVEDILRSHLHALGKKKGAVAILDPTNGEVLSLVSLPAYDNNLFAQGISFEDYGMLINNPDQPLYNRALSGEYPSGSTFKLIVAAAALEQNIINPYTTIISTGGLAIGQWFFPDWKAGGHGATDIYKAISESVNTFFYYIGGGYEDFEGLGVDKLTEYARKFGLGDRLGIDLTAEGTGFLPSPEWKKETKKERWYIGDTYHYAIGQGDILVTPLQVAAYTSVFASHGVLYLPHVVHQVEDALTKNLSTVEAAVVNEQVVSRKNIDIVRTAMRLAVTQGSARRLSSLPFSVAGKTGTAEWSSTREPHAWFTGFAPYENPEVVVTVLIEEGGEGSEVAVPLAQEIFQKYFDLKNNQSTIINLD